MNRPVAIVGMAGRFPGAPDLARFWELLSAGRDAVGPVPPDRWDHAAIDDPDHAIPAVGCFLDDVDLFDAPFFGISPREAAVLDPAQSLVLETGWSALEDSGYRVADVRGSRTGVYVGGIWHDHELRRKDHGRPTTRHSIVGNAIDIVAARLSYVLGVTGPSMAVGTGCSSSLVALHLACRAIAAGDIDGAVVSGANLMLDPDVTIGLTHFGGLSPTGLCRPFGAGADGFVRGEGAIAVYVKPLDAALRDGDRVRAVILASAVNNDGGGSSLVTPNGPAQEALLRELYGPDGVDPARLAYVEAHGTGTARGDAAEAGSLGRVLGGAGGRVLPIGSVKSNIGHLETVAGLAGLVKAVLSLEHGVVPPSLNAAERNPAIDFAGLGLDIACDPVPLPEGTQVCLGVNSFGWGGTNAHVVLSRPPVVAPAPAAPEPGPYVLRVSAHTATAMERRVADVDALIESGADARATADALAHHRDHFAERTAVVVDGAARTPLRGRARDAGRVAFVFPGQGAQWAGMGAALLGHDAAFTDSVQRCADALRPVVGWDLRELLTGGLGDGWLAEVEKVQPALWATSVSLAAAWRAAGVVPDLVIGHSQGEIAAATVAGALSLADAALVVGRRSALLREVAGRGRMLAVDLDADAARAALEGFEDSVSLAVHNGPRSCVLSGEADMVLLLREILEADGVFCRLVDVDYASHSPQVDDLLPRVEAALAAIAPRRGDVPLLSTVDPQTVPALDAAYWARNLRSPVRFADAVGRAVDDGVTHLVEISPHPGLTPALGQLAEGHDDPPVVLSTLRRGEGAPADLERAFATAWVAGLPALGPRPARRPDVALPAYPWERRRHLPTDAGRGPARPARPAVALRPDPSGDGWTGSTEVSPQAHRWLTEHRVGDAVLYPAGGHLDLLEGALRALADGPVHLHDVELPAALPLPDLVTLAVTWRPAGERAGRAAVASLRPGETTWTEHARARARFGGDLEPVAFPVHLLDAPARDAEEFLADCAARDLHYGPAFAGVVRLHRAGEQALARLEVPRAGGRTALWDAVLQAALALVPDGPVVPTALAHAVLDDRPAHWVHAVHRDGRVDLVVFDADRTVIGRVDGLVLTPLPGARRDAVDARVLRLRFDAADPPAAAPLPARTVLRGPQELNLRRVADALPDAVALADGEPVPACDLLVFVAPCGVPEQRDGLTALARDVTAALAANPGVALVVVTGSALPAPDGSPVEPGASLYAGFTATLQSEHPSLRARLVDVDAVTPALVAELTATDDLVVLREGNRWVGRRDHGAGPDPVRPWRTGGEQPYTLVASPLRRLDALTRVPRPRRRPGPGQVEIAVDAVALNFIDVMKALDVYPDRAAAEGLGLECAGAVLAVGDGVADIAVGDVVVGCGTGLLGSHAVVDARHVLPIPAGLDPAQACALPMALATAWYSLVDVARIEPGETVLVHSAAGGVGLAALAVARLRGAVVLATAGTEEKRAHLRDLGVEHVFDSRGLDWVAGVLAATGGHGVDVVLNSLAGAAQAAGLDVLAPDGRFVELGKRDIHAGSALDLRAFRGAGSFAAVDLAGMLRRTPDRFARLLRDVWQHALGPLPVRELPFAQAEAAFRALAGGAHIGKVVLTGPRDGGAVVPDPTVRPGGTYLVTGGRGALGLALAEDLVARGADAVALLGRSAPDPAALARIEGLRASGAQVLSVTADVADEVDLTRALDEVRAALPPLRGVFHAAGVLDDATVGALDAEQVARVLAPKFDGALLLDRLTADDPLDVFVLFSSVAAYVGTAGQAAYAAANAGLDGLAARRRRRGRPGLSVQWGSVGDVGLAAARADRLAARGLAAMPVADCWPALWRFLAEGETVVCFADLDPQRWVQTHPAVAALPSWAPLVAAGPTSSGPVDGMAVRVRALPAPERRELVESAVRQDAASVLMLDEAVLVRDRDVALTSLGLDSLMTIELRNRLESTLGLRLSPTLLWQHGSVARLGSVLTEMVEAVGE